MSDRKIVDYKFVWGDGDDLEKKVNSLLKDGYYPFFGHCVCRGTVSQVMVKYED